MMPVLTNLNHLLAAGAEAAHGAAEKGGKHYDLSVAGVGVYVVLVLAIVAIILGGAKKHLQPGVFKDWKTRLFEHVFLFIEKLCVTTIGPHGRKYVPFMFTLWTIIFVGNLIALFFPTSITADFSFNLGLALVCIGYVQWEGMKANGVFGHFKHFAGPKLGLALIPITLMIFVIEIISELMKNLSLSLRLFGNINGGHEAAVAMNDMGHFVIDGWHVLIPFGSFLIVIKLLTVIVQALIFCLLTCVYLSLVTHHEEDHDHAKEGSAGAEPAPAH